jgi:hypothetical protein
MASWPTKASEDLDRRMLEMIERYRKLIAEKRASGGQA